MSAYPRYTLNDNLPALWCMQRTCRQWASVWLIVTPHISSLLTAMWHLSYWIWVACAVIHTQKVLGMWTQCNITSPPENKMDVVALCCTPKVGDGWYESICVCVLYRVLWGYIDKCCCEKQKQRGRTCRGLAVTIVDIFTDCFLFPLSTFTSSFHGLSIIFSDKFIGETAFYSIRIAL